MGFRLSTVYFNSSDNKVVAAVDKVPIKKADIYQSMQSKSSNSIFQRLFNNIIIKNEAKSMKSLFRP